ncbi:MAG: M2 family metallopeptidase [Candidatus Marinimicrobia bacterium]|nr:M2 family metallopeptidase [Candidatus Neomarinimicrobiota bacterium]
MKKMLVLFIVSLTIISCSDKYTADSKDDLSSSSFVAEVQAYIDSYTETYMALDYDASEAQWQSNTMIVEGDTVTSHRTNMAVEKLTSFTGSIENIEHARNFLKRKDELESLQIKQLEVILYSAANSPQTVPELVKQRIAAQTAQVETLFGFDFKIDGKSVTTNQIDETLRSSTKMKERLAAWSSSKEVGVELRDGLTNLVSLRNSTVQALGYDDYFQYQVSDYDMTVEEMTDLMNQFNRELRPLYRELHTYWRYELAEKYSQPVPKMLPAHWLPNRWGQDWTALVTVEGFDLAGALAEKDAEWVVKQAERFYVSLGFDPLPESFYEKSSLYPLPEDATYKKNNHASAWHLDLKNDIRSLMSVEPNPRWYRTTHHELGHIYYYIAYTNENVPPLLRSGANRGYHEAIGSLMGLASMQKPFVESIGLLTEGGELDEIQALMFEALRYVVFIPFSCGVMTMFEKGLYDGSITQDNYNAKWWEVKRRYQGIVPPGERGEEYNDAASKTHINNDAAQYYDYAISYMLLFQLHNHIAKNILNQDPHATNYFGSKEVGTFLWSILEKGASGDWRELLREKTGGDLSAAAMLEYFQPLMAWLQEKNAERIHTLEEI